MKKTTLQLILCLAVAASFPAQAGDGRDRHEREHSSAEHRVERMARDLDLNEEQAASVLEIFTAADLERDTLREEHKKQIHHDICTLMSSTTNQVRAVLTPKQSAEFDDLLARKAEHREEHGRWRDDDRGPPPDCDEDDES